MVIRVFVYLNCYTVKLIFAAELVEALSVGVGVGNVCDRPRPPERATWYGQGLHGIHGFSQIY